ncbi:hypothetical protein AA313_de0208284 [Arthrobotrys entomopaga]|nr:hypothetical protein AA313_de0208284 [Arthrobotrys entomopaga]
MVTNNLDNPPCSVMEKPKHEDYTVGWATVLDTELNASRLLLDEEHEPLPLKEDDDNIYILGRIGAHNVVISFAGTNTAKYTVSNMLRTFPNIRFGLLVGVGGGAPAPPNLDDPSQDIRLGDVVVGKSEGDHGGLLQYEMDDEEFTIKSHLNKPPNLLLKAVKLLKFDHSCDKGRMNQYIQETIRKASGLPKLKACQFPGYGQDKLFNTSYRHAHGGTDCSDCDVKMIKERSQRETTTPEVHYGLIASANTSMKSAQHRNALRNKWNVSCFETEAVGLVDNFPCVVIRGICDYSDDHKNLIWQPYAAIAAGAYAKDLLRVIRIDEVMALPHAPGPPSLNSPHIRYDIDQRIRAATQKEFDRLRGILQKTEAQLLTLEGKIASLNQSQDMQKNFETRMLILERKVADLSHDQKGLQVTEARLLPLEEKVACLSKGQEVLQKTEAQLRTLEEKVASLSQPSPSE